MAGAHVRGASEAETQWPAPAKLNLFLHVTGRRADGYHELQTLFQLIDLCDTLRFEVREDGRIDRPPGRRGVAGSDLVVRAAKALQAATGFPCRCRACGSQAHSHGRRPRGRQLGRGDGAAGAK